MSASAADTPLDTLLKSIETRYNQAKTLQVLFKEDYTQPGHPRSTESGILMLRKPGRMRWDYSQPKGKLFLSDGKNLWLYTPADNRAQKLPLKDSEDMRVPLRFLLGKLNFEKEFQNIKATPDGADTRITADPKSENLPYSHVEFVVTSRYEIKEVKVVGYDRSITDFTFDQERMDPPLDAKLFQFKLPPGAELVEGQ